MKQRRFMEVAAQPAAGILNERQSSTLRRLSDLLQDGDSSATAARALDKLSSRLTESPVSRKQLYVRGLDELDFHSLATFRKPFAQATAAEAESLLQPIRQPWVYVSPSTLVDFLRAAKQDLRSTAIRSSGYVAEPQYASQGLHLVRI